MSYIKNEKGYGLLLTVFVILLFSILAVSLLTVVLSGASKTAVREDVTQATELSDKGIEHIVSQIHNDIADALGTTGLPRSKFPEKLSEILNKYDCGIGNLNVTGETGIYDVCVDEFVDVIDLDGKKNPLRKLVTFKSTGDVDGRIQTITSKMEIGAGTVPDALKYVLGTFEKGREGAGNIYLHGGVEVYGDIKAGSHLFTFDHGPGLHGNTAHWRETTLPVLHPSQGHDTAKIVLGGGLYQFRNTLFGTKLKNHVLEGGNVEKRSEINFYNNHLKWSDSSIYKASTLHNMFKGKLPVLAKRDWPGNRVDIDANINEGRNNILPTAKSITVKSGTRINENSSISLKAPNYHSEINFNGDNSFKKGIVSSRSKVTFNKGDYKFDSLYVNGNVVIGNENTTSENTNSYSNVTIGGYSKDRGAQLFVSGNVTIRGVNLTSDLTIYSTGTITIQYSTIQGKEFSSDKEGSLITFSKGRIQIANNSLYKDAPSELKGYFYSDSNFEMFGVGSKMKIHGGIAAKRITLNAIRGNYRDEKRDFKYAKNPTLLSSPSRLVIQYDTELIENYLRMNPPEPVIYEVDPPELIERSY